jgi:GDP-4-dehydro-6-deoxy-D-mannose reductase
MHALHVNGTTAVLSAVERFASSARVVVTGTAAEYGAVPSAAMPISETQPCHPESAYGQSKYRATLVALETAARTGMFITVARPFNIIGPGMPPGLLVSDIVARLRQLGDQRPAVLHTGRLDTARDFLAAGDVAAAFQCIAASGRSGEVYNVCSGVATPVADIVRTLVDASGGVVSVLEDVPLRRPTDVLVVYGNPAKLYHETGFAPRTTLGDVLRETWSGRSLDALS